MENNERKITLFKVIMIVVIFLLILLAVFIAAYIKSSGENNKNTSKEDSKPKANETVVQNDNTIEQQESAFAWEEYPEDMLKVVSKWLFDDETVMGNDKEDNSESAWHETKLKTMYSISKNYPDAKDIFLEGFGDGTKATETECNYPRFNPNSESLTEEEKNAKYTDPIEFKLAVYNETTHSDASTIEERVKKQYEELVTNKKSDSEEAANYTFTVGKLYFMNGNNKSKEEYLKYSRAKKIKVTLDSGRTYEFDVEDTNKVQAFDINYIKDSIESPVNAKIEVLETYSGTESQDIYISDIQFSIDSNIPQGR